MNICAVCHEPITYLDFDPPGESEVAFTVADTAQGPGIVVQGTTSFLYCANCARTQFFESRLPRVRAAADAATRKRK